MVCRGDVMRKYFSGVLALITVFVFTEELSASAGNYTADISDSSRQFKSNDETITQNYWRRFIDYYQRKRLTQESEIDILAREIQKDELILRHQELQEKIRGTGGGDYYQIESGEQNNGLTFSEGKTELGENNENGPEIRLKMIAISGSMKKAFIVYRGVSQWVREGGRISFQCRVKKIFKENIVIINYQHKAVKINFP